MRPQHIRALWEAYREHVVPAGAEMEQLAETRRAFFAGAVAAFGLVTEGLSEGEEPTAEDIALLDDIKAELAAFNLSQGVTS